MTAVEVAFWVSAGPDRLHARRLSAAAARACATARAGRCWPVARQLPRVSLIVAAHDEEDVIERKLRRTRSRSTTRPTGWR